MLICIIYKGVYYWLGDTAYFDLIPVSKWILVLKPVNSMLHEDIVEFMLLIIKKQMICKLICKPGLLKVVCMCVYFVPTFAIEKVSGRRELMAIHVLKLIYKNMLVTVVLFWKCSNVRNKGLVCCLQYGYFFEFFSQAT